MINISITMLTAFVPLVPSFTSVTGMRPGRRAVPSRTYTFLGMLLPAEGRGRNDVPQWGSESHIGCLGPPPTRLRHVRDSRKLYPLQQLSCGLFVPRGKGRMVRFGMSTIYALFDDDQLQAFQIPWLLSISVTGPTPSGVKRCPVAVLALSHESFTAPHIPLVYGMRTKGRAKPLSQINNNNLTDAMITF